VRWTRQYEFQVRARERLKILIPIVFFIIFMLLYVTFHFASEATTVMLSVVYAMTGGVILQWLLDYNFSVAVWVGYMALYSVAVRTRASSWSSSCTRRWTADCGEATRSQRATSGRPPWRAQSSACGRS
jgi:hypothetical protein